MIFINIVIFEKGMKPINLCWASSLSIFPGNNIGMFFLNVVDDGYVICKKNCTDRGKGVWQE